MCYTVVATRMTAVTLSSRAPRTLVKPGPLCSNDSKTLVIARIVHEMGALICVVVAVVQVMRRHVGSQTG